MEACGQLPRLTSAKSGPVIEFMFKIPPARARAHTHTHTHEKTSDVQSQMNVSLQVKTQNNYKCSNTNSGSSLHV